MHYIAFYTIYYIENISFSIIYAIHSAETNLPFKYSLVLFVCLGFWCAISFQLIYYRFLHPSDHVRQHTKQNLASIGQLKVFPRLKKSKSCEEMMDQQDQLCDSISLQLGNERWHNRFSKENRQKLISQQQAIDQRVKQTRAQKQQVGLPRQLSLRRTSIDCLGSFDSSNERWFSSISGRRKSSIGRRKRKRNDSHADETSAAGAGDALGQGQSLVKQTSFFCTIVFPLIQCIVHLPDRIKNLCYSQIDKMYFVCFYSCSRGAKRERKRHSDG